MRILSPMLRLIGIGICLLSMRTALFAQSAEIIQWSSSMESARHEASNEGKKIFLYFSGSDWCKPCILLREKNINSEPFSQFVKKNLVMLQADFPRLKKNRLPKERLQQNEALAEKYNPEGTFPLIVILDSRGNVLAKTGYHDEAPEEFVNRIERLLN